MPRTFLPLFVLLSILATAASARTVAFARGDWSSHRGGICRVDFSAENGTAACLENSNVVFAKLSAQDALRQSIRYRGPYFLHVLGPGIIIGSGHRLDVKHAIFENVTFFGEGSDEPLFNISDDVETTIEFHQCTFSWTGTVRVKGPRHMTRFFGNTFDHSTVPAVHVNTDWFVGNTVVSPREGKQPEAAVRLNVTNFDPNGMRNLAARSEGKYANSSESFIRPLENDRKYRPAIKEHPIHKLRRQHEEKMKRSRFEQEFRHDLSPAAAQKKDIKIHE